MGTSEKSDFLKWEDLVYLADSFQAGNCNEMRFLGGEPTLHPDFLGFVEYSLKRNFSVTVFTSGIIGEKVKAGLRNVFSVPDNARKLHFLCNINDPSLSPKTEVEKTENFFSEFGEYITPGFNIYNLDFDLSFLFRYINQYGFKRHIRLGITHPIVREDNSYIHPKEMRQVIERLVGFLPQFYKNKVSPGLDCGFPLCRMTDAELGQLFKATGGNLKFSCGAPLDIGPDMSVWPCFPLSSIEKKSYYDFDSLRDAETYYQDFMRRIRVEAGGVFPECDACEWREKELCRGGCAAHILREMDKEGPIRHLKIGEK
jgi:radical SAM protein with 4Fe4S-binding SPASM domain